MFVIDINKIRIKFVSIKNCFYYYYFKFTDTFSKWKELVYDLERRVCGRSKKISPYI